VTVPLGATARRLTLPITLLVQSASSAAVIAPTVAAPRLLEQLQLGPAAVGVFIGLVYLAAMFSSPLGAHLVRRYGPIRSSQLALLVSAVGLLLVALPAAPFIGAPTGAAATAGATAGLTAPAWHQLGLAGLAGLGALLIGLGYGPITPASSQMLARTTSLRHYALVFSIKQTGVPMGGVIAGLMVPPLVAWGGGAAALAGTAALCLAGLLSALPLGRSLDDQRERHGHWPSALQLMAPVRLVLGHAQLRSLALCSFVFSMVQVCLTSYFVSYLTGDLGWTLLAAGAALSASQVCGVCGRIAWGVVSDRWLGPRRMLLTLAGLIVACCLAMSWPGRSSPALAVLALLCLFGATAVGWNGVYLATVARLVPHAQAATATAGTLFFTFFGVVIGPPLFGLAGGLLGGLGPAFALLVGPMGVAVFMLLRSRLG
jgi:predicted MFS family arabinose efflux permease